MSFLHCPGFAFLNILCLLHDISIFAPDGADMLYLIFDCWPTYFLDHAPPHHWERDHPGSLLVSLGPSPPAENAETRPTQI